MIIVRKFQKHQRVRMTEEGREFCRPPPGRRLDDRGRVVGFGYRYGGVRILRDGHRTPESFPSDFWESCS